MRTQAWEEKAFEDVIDFREGPGILAKDFRESGVPLIRLAGLDRGVSLLQGCDYLDPVTVSKRWSHFQLDLGDVLLSTSASLGRIAVVGEEGVGAVPYTGIIRMRPKDHSIYAPFITYLLEGPDFQRQAEMVGVGSVIRHFGPMHLKQMTVLVPPLAEQRAIAHVLGTLDDKIELNRRMNETLEAMARALFTSWFVDFEPVRAKMEGRWRRGESLPGLSAEHYDLFPDRLVASELGEVPEGWKVRALGEFGQVVTGKTPSTRRPEYYGEHVPFLRIPDMRGKMYAINTEVMLSTQGANAQAQKTLPPGSISVSCIATPGLVVLNHHTTQTNQQINSIIPHDQSASKYLYWVCNHLSSDIKTGGLGGSVFSNMNKAAFSALPAIDPQSAVISAFDNLVASIHEAMLSNEEQAHSLAVQRDALLPRLVSGEVRMLDATKSRDAY